MAPFNFTRSIAHADAFIRRWGLKGYLVRSGVKRPMWAAVQDYKPTERGLFLDGAQRMYISAKNLTIEPSHELDHIEWNGATYKILMPPVGPRPAGVPVYHDCSVVKFTA
jgi:hypothetical protein